jgi:hypothetical protein
VKLTFYFPLFLRFESALERTYGSDKCRIADEQNKTEKEKHYWKPHVLSALFSFMFDTCEVSAT